MFHFTPQERQVILFFLIVFLFGNALELFKKRNPHFFEFAEASSLDQFRRKIDLNRASQADLEGLPYIGPTSAERIIAFREKRGAFVSVEELKEIDGIGPSLFEKVRPLVYIKE